MRVTGRTCGITTEVKRGIKAYIPVAETQFLSLSLSASLEGVFLFGHFVGIGWVFLGVLSATALLLASVLCAAWCYYCCCFTCPRRGRAAASASASASASTAGAKTAEEETTFLRSSHV